MRKKSRRLLAILLAVTTFITPDASSVSGVGGVLRFNGAISSAKEVASSASAATEGAIETATASTTETPEESKSLVVSGSSVGNLRIIFTTDVHGQIVNYDYQDGQFVDRGLNLEYSIIKDARTEAGDGNYLTFDVGDSIMDFTTDYIYNQDSTVVQPVFKALALVGYDAITMGNHDFDYGYDYLMGQLQSTGLTNLCVLSNVYSVNNFQPAIGSENRIIEKKIKNGLGQEITVKVGILAETTPNLSTRTEAFSDKVFTEDIIINAEKQVKSLKEQGAGEVIRGGDGHPVQLRVFLQHLVVLARMTMGHAHHGDFHRLHIHQPSTVSFLPVAADSRARAVSLSSRALWAAISSSSAGFFSAAKAQRT